MLPDFCTNRRLVATAGITLLLAACSSGSNNADPGTASLQVPSPSAVTRTSVVAMLGTARVAVAGAGVGGGAGSAGNLGVTGSGRVLARAMARAR